MRVIISPGGPDITVARLDGDLDSDIIDVFAEIERAVKTPRLMLDCAGMQKIKSIGVRGWLDGLSRLTALVKVSFCGCPEAFMDMAVMVPDFTRDLPITSFYATWGCEECAREVSFLVEVPNGQPRMPESRVCAKCGGTLVPDKDLKADLDFVFATG